MPNPLERAEICFKDLRLTLEDQFLDRIKPVIDRLKEKYTFLNEYHLQRDKVFYSLISSALNIDEHYAIKYIVGRIELIFGSNLRLKFFLYQSTVFNITCLPTDECEDKCLYLFVSQHFFNNLTEDEQVGIIGHEIAHFLLGHLQYPLYEILEYPFDLEEINGLKGDLLNWSKACEITADMIGLVANDFNYKAYSTAIIKHHTGLNDSSISKFNISPVVQLVLKQYDQLANDPLYSGETSTHPLTPLRVKIINSVTKTKLIKHYGEEVSAEERIAAVQDYNETINNLIKGIYPEMIQTIHFAEEIMLPLMIAVALSDGHIDRNELAAISRIYDSNRAVKDYQSIIEGNTKKGVADLVTEGIALTKKASLSKHDIVPILRSLLIVAASDEDIVKEELETIYRYAKAFGFTRKDIILILQTHNPIHY